MGFRKLGERPRTFASLGNLLGVPKFVFLLKADFNGPDLAAPLPASLGVPYVSVGGPLVITDSEAKLSISGGELVCSGGKAAPSYGNPGLWSEALSRTAGLAYLTAISPNATNTVVQMGYDIGQGGGLIEYFRFNNNAKLEVLPGLIQISGYTGGTQYNPRIVLRTKGAYYLLDSILCWIENSATHNTLYAAIANYNAAFSVETLRVARLPGKSSDAVPGNGYDVWGHRDLDITDQIAFADTDQEFAHTADFMLSFTVGQNDSSTNVWFRMHTAADKGINCWRLRWTNTGYLRLSQCTDSGEVNRAMATGVIDTDKHVQLVVKSNVYTAYVDGVQVWQYVDPDNYLTDGTVAIYDTDSGDSISNLTTRTLDGVANVGSPNHPGYGIATAVLPGPRAAGDTRTSEANALHEFMLDSLPSSGQIEDWFRSPTVGTDGWRITVNSAGDLELDEVVSGTPTQRGLASAVLSGGERIVYIPDGETISVYYDTTKAFEYASAASNKTETGCELETLGTGGRVSNIISWPRDLSNAPNTARSSLAKQALDKMAR